MSETDPASLSHYLFLELREKGPRSGHARPGVVRSSASVTRNVQCGFDTPSFGHRRDYALGTISPQPPTGIQAKAQHISPLDIT
jgi:hypothetical protein